MGYETETTTQSIFRCSNALVGKFTKKIRLAMKLHLNNGYIYLTHFDHGRFTLSTGEKCEPADWNAKTETVRATHPDMKGVNDYLQRVKEETPKVIRHLLNSGKSISNKSFKDELLKRVNSKVSIGNATFIEFCDDLLTNSVKNKSRKDCLKATVSKLKAYKGSCDWRRFSPCSTLRITLPGGKL